MDEEKMSKVEKQETFKKMSKVEKQKTLEYTSIVMKEEIKKLKFEENYQKQKYQRIRKLIEKFEKGLNLIDRVSESYEFCNDLDQVDCNMLGEEGCQWDDKCSWNENPQQSIPGWPLIKDDLMGVLDEWTWREGSGDECETCGGTGGRGPPPKKKIEKKRKKKRQLKKMEMEFPALCPYPGCYHLKFATSKELRDHIEKVHEYRELPSLPMLKRAGKNRPATQPLAITLKQWPKIGQKVEAFWAFDKKWYPAIMRYWNQGGITVEWLNSNEKTSDISLDKISTTVREPRR